MHFELKRKHILLTGATGFLGSHIYQELLRKGVQKRNIRTTNTKKLNLLSTRNCLLATKDIDLVIHCAGNVGGIGKNMRNPGALFYENAKMGIDIIEAARKNKVEKIVLVGTVCSYPKYTDVPFKEADLWLGYPEETNAPYGLAKKMLIVQSQAYRRQYGSSIINVIPVNIYGPGDSFDLDDGHVIPTLIAKCSIAKKTRAKEVVLWGDGSATREFLYVDDAARAIVRAAQVYDDEHPLNIGSGNEISIRELAHMIKELTRYQGEIVWDKSYPNGQPRRLLDSSKAKSLGINAKTSLQIGLKKTIHWYNQSL